jgi:hypothetical protein
MLTIKIILPNGSQIVEETCKVYYDHGEKGEGIDDNVLYIEPKSTAQTRIREGEIYVMNENGKTIANYYLGERIPA